MTVESTSDDGRPATTGGGRITRRDLLKISLGLSGLVAFQGLRRFLSYESAPPMVTRAVLEEPVLYAVGSLSPVPEIHAWLGRDTAGFYALSGVCTHLGCLVRQEGDQLVCPCHGSRFTQDGAVLQGPAAQSLRHVEVMLSADNRLVVDTQVVVPAHQRLAMPG
jgi:cytochrome b6-f complex iron-sulfur subunit